MARKDVLECVITDQWVVRVLRWLRHQRSSLCSVVCMYKMDSGNVGHELRTRYYLNVLVPLHPPKDFSALILRYRHYMRGETLCRAIE